jgi:hypothetical protein
MGFDSPPRWADVEKNLFIPIDPKTNVLLKHDDYQYTGGMCVPDTLTTFWPLGYQASAAVEAETYQFYIERAETFLGMPMFSSLFSVWAARQGNRRLASQMLAGGVGNNVIPPYHQLIEATARHGYSDASATVFLANAAGYLMALYTGLPGIQIGGGEPSEWSQFPVVLPDGWQSIEVDKLWVRGQPARLRAPHGAKRAALEMLS